MVIAHAARAAVYQAVAAMTEWPGHTEATYARLPEDLLADLLADTPNITRQVTDLLIPAFEQRHHLRAAAESLDLLRDSQPSRTDTVCAVDGGFAVERTVAVDIVMAVAVGIEGFSEGPCAWDDNQFDSFHCVLVHDVDNERLARAAMIAHELHVLADAPHEVRIYDGSHVTPVIQLNSGFSSISDTVSMGAVDVADEVDLASALEAFVNEPGSIAMPKYDSSTDLTVQLGRAIGADIPGDDKYVTSLILEPGEYTTPRAVPRDPWRQLHLGARAGSAAAATGAVVLYDELLEPLRRRQLFYLYWRPHLSSPSYRIEVKPDLARNEAALNLVLATLANQITGPFVREPYPQYLADVMAKSVGLGLSALQAAAHLQVNRAHPELAEFLIHSYRTEGI